MNRREFMVAASGVAGGAAAATAAASTPVVAQEEGSDGDSGGNATANESDGGGAENATDGGGGGGGGGGPTETVTLVNYAFEPATESPMQIQPGTTVKFVWETDNHNIAVDSTPDGSSWEGHEAIENAPFEYEHTFETEGTYEFHCTPHVGLGMTGTIEVTEDAGGGGGGGAAAADVDIHDLGVPLQKHWLGIAAIFAIFMSLVFTFYLLKYGESAHTSSPGRR